MPRHLGYFGEPMKGLGTIELLDSGQKVTWEASRMWPLEKLAVVITLIFLQNCSSNHVYLINYKTG